MFLVMAFLLMTVVPHLAYADQAATDLTLAVEGRAPVVKDDEARARDEAVKNALEKAIMQATAGILSEKGEDEQSQATKNILLGRADRYIRNYRIISEVRQQEQFTAQVHVLVALAPLRDDLIHMGVLPEQRGKDGIAVILSLSGVKKYNDFILIRTFLQNRPKIVKSAYPCYLSWQRVDFDLVLLAEVEQLVAELEKSGRYIVESVSRNQNGAQVTVRMKEEVK